MGWHVFVQSLLAKCSCRIELHPIMESYAVTHGARTDGSNAFTKARFLVPFMCGFRGQALYVDGADMLVRSDPAELWDLYSHRHAVQLVKHEYATKAPKKYRGTSMEADNKDYPRKNWSSVMLWNCGHRANECLTPDFVAQHSGSDLHRFAWLEEDRKVRRKEIAEARDPVQTARHMPYSEPIGILPREWNWLVGEYQHNPWAKIVHFTLGIPAFREYADCDYATEWQQMLVASSQGTQEMRSALKIKSPS